MNQSSTEALTDLVARAKAAHTDAVLVPLHTIETARAAAEASQARRRAQHVAALATNQRRKENSRAAVERALQAVLAKNPHLPRHNLAAAIDRWLRLNWSRSFSLMTISARLDELLPRVARHQKKSQTASEV